MANGHVRQVVLAIAVVAAQLGWHAIARAGQAHPLEETRSEDAYVLTDAQKGRWTLGTARAERVIELQHGRFGTVSLHDKQSDHHYLPPSTHTDEFRIDVDGTAITGASGGWTLVSSKTSVLARGEISLAIALEGHSLRVEQTYVVYPGTSIVRQWTTYRNISSRPFMVTDPHFLALRVPIDAKPGLTLWYMTGGGYQTGSQMLKSVKFTSDYARTFDSADDAEVSEVAGAAYGYALRTGSGAYMQWFGVTDDPEAGGLYVGFDYWGRWAADVGRFHGKGGYLGIRVAGYRRQLGPEESIVTPKAFSGVFSGPDLDTMGNDLKTWQYRYLWDYTNDDYFAKIRFTAQMRWQFGKGEVVVGGGTQDNWDYRIATLFHATNVMRELGADILWQDAGWHNLLGDNDGPNFGAVKRYLEKHGMGLAVWWQLYTVASKSEAYKAHPEWLTNPGADHSNLDTSRQEVIDYLLEELGEKVRTWGDFQWRLDGTPVAPVKGDETPMLEQHHKVFALFDAFRRRHSGSSIDVCAGGGNLMGFEALRMSDKSQLTDGGPMYISNYYSSYLFPPDKFDDWTRVGNFSWRHARSSLAISPSWTGDRGLYGHEPGLLLNDGLENVRRNFEVYRYLLSQGVAGRWSLVYHPRVEGDDPVYYLQRQSADGKRGVIILKRFVDGSVTVFPKGLHAAATYDVRFAVSHRVLSRSGADLMQHGISLTNPAPGELVYVGLPNHPGSGLDHTAPTAPGNVRKRVATNVGITGVEIMWEPSSDENWLSYYQLYRDGEPVAKVAKGTFYFDFAGGPESVGRQYEVEAVDGDGNSSMRVPAALVEGGPIVYTAQGGFLSGRDYSYQGANGWTYEEWNGDRRIPLAWDGALGQMGLYTGGSGAGGDAPLIGASWMSPGASSDAVRTFTLPAGGRITVSGRVHKDLYHQYGDGVGVKVLMNDRQLWPEAGWHHLAADDTTGVEIDLTLMANRGDRLHFVVNRRGTTLDDETVWNPVITYAGSPGGVRWRTRREWDDTSTRLAYRGSWQKLGVSPWGSDLDQGYLPGWSRGTLTVSRTPGDTVTIRFNGTGIEVYGQTGSANGIARITLDGTLVGTVDTFTPQVVYGWSRELTSLRDAAQWAPSPPTRLWGVGDLEPGEHELEIVVTGTKNPESTSVRIGIDSVVILEGELAKPVPKKGRP